LRALQRWYQSRVIPLADPTPHDMDVEGYASTTDLDRVKMRGWAFGYPLLSWRELPPLYFKHDTSRPIGRTEELAYDDFGNLIIRAIVTHPTARRCGAYPGSCG